MGFIRNSLMLLLLTLSSFGSMVCVEPDGERCACSVLARVIIAQFSDEFAEAPCPCDCESDCDSEDCGEQLVGMESNLCELAKAPAKPAYVEVDAEFFSDSLASLLAQSAAIRERLRSAIPPLILHGRDPALSSIVLRV